MKKVLMVIAHADDEIICGWPIFQDDTIEKEVLLCSSDLYNPQRQWCAHRKHVLIELCKEKNIPIKVYDLPSGFYRIETRQGSLAKMQEDIMSDIDSTECDAIFTHNPLGEYGHLDHKMCFELVLRASKKPVIFSDILLKSNWQSHETIPPLFKKLYYTDVISKDHVLDESYYAYCEQKYRDAGVWTWNKPPVKKCNLYQLVP
jgi:LmbE family N-acetylglucosaminyl deacetylase